jgi:demethylmenaquinone methyltransferase / 2-methoxy-6-polyprenyl-1,4-benzoquinol methylase
MTTTDVHTKAGTLPGTRPPGATTEQEASAHVQGMFSGIAPTYDFLNHALTLNIDQYWRRKTALKFKSILSRPDARALDLCCGTGDLTFALEKVRRQAASAVTGASSQSQQTWHPVVGSDFAQPMLDRAQRKARNARSTSVFANADAMSMPFADATFDLVTSAFGFRNLVNYEAGLREIARVLKPGGAIGLLECTEPPTGITASIFRFYFRRILPVVGGAVSGNREAYTYLPTSVQHFFSREGLAKLLKDVGYEEVESISWNFGSIILHCARPPAIARR